MENKFENVIIEKYKFMGEEFEQNYCSRTATGIYGKRPDSIRLKKWIEHYDKTYEKIT